MTSYQVTSVPLRLVAFAVALSNAVAGQAAPPLNSSAEHHFVGNVSRKPADSEPRTNGSVGQQRQFLASAVPKHVDTEQRASGTFGERQPVAHADTQQRANGTSWERQLLASAVAGPVDTEKRANGTSRERQLLAHAVPVHADADQRASGTFGEGQLLAHAEPDVGTGRRTNGTLGANGTALHRREMRSFIRPHGSLRHQAVLSAAQLGEHGRDKAGVAPEHNVDKWLLVLFEVVGLGFLGVDRLYLGVFNGGALNGVCFVLKLLTFGGVGVWGLLDYLLVMSNALRREGSINLLGMQASFMDETVEAAFLLGVMGAIFIGGLVGAYLLSTVGWFAVFGQPKYSRP